jgi:hypothetical protein
MCNVISIHLLTVFARNVNLRRLRAVAVAAGLLSCVVARSVVATDVWHTSTVRTIYPHADGSVVVTFSTDSPSCTSANTPHYYYVAVGQNGVTAEALKNILAAFLSAAAQGRTVQFNFSDTTTACYINRALVIYQ